MPRPLKVFKTHIGFYDLIVAASSMKAAAQAWNVSPRIFTHGLAAPTTDPVAVRAAMDRPGTMLKRLHGQKGAFVPDPGLPRPPAPSPGHKKRRAEANRQRRHKQARERQEQRLAQKQAREAAKKELAEIARLEAGLRKKRQALREQFHVRGP